MKPYDIHKDFRILVPLRYKKYTRFRRFILNIFFLMTIMFYKPKKKLIKKVYKIKGHQGHKIYVVVLSHRDEKEDRALLYLHGGGFQTEGAVVQMRNMTQMIYKTGHKGIFVKYRLAPKYAFPIGLEDCYHALLWTINQLGYQPQQISVAGESAGGNLSVGLSMLVRDRLKQSLNKQLLFYPVVSHDLRTESKTIFDDTPMWNTTLNDLMWQSYLRDEKTDMLGYVSFNHGNLKNLPATYIETAEFDPLRDEGIWLDKALVKAGVFVESHHTKHSVHGYDAVFYSDFVKRRQIDRKLFLRRDLNEEN